MVKSLSFGVLCDLALHSFDFINGGPDLSIKQRRKSSAVEKSCRLNSEDKGVRFHFRSDAYQKAGDEFNKYLVAHGISEAQAGHAGARDTAEILFLKPEWIRKEKIKEASPEKGVPGDPSVATPELGKIYLVMKVKFGLNEIRKLIASN